MWKDVDRETRRHCLRFLGAAYFLYVISISIKMVYGAEMVEIISSFSATKAEVSLGLTFYYVAYSVGQFLLAPLIERLDMRRFIALSTLLSAVVFGLISVSGALWQVYLLLALAGFCQTGIWGGVMYFVGRYLPSELSGFASKLLGTGLAIGTVLTYGFGALFVALSGWQATFLFFAVLTVISVPVFLLALRSAERTLAFVREQNRSGAASAPAAASPADRTPLWGTVAFFGVAVFLGSCVYYGFNNWFPSLLSEVFLMPGEYAILFTLLLPLAQAPCPMVIISLAERMKSLYRTGALSALIACVLFALLFFTHRLSMVLVILLSVVSLFFMRGLNNMICTYTPLVMKGQIDPGILSLIMNATATLAAAAVPFVFALVLDSAGGWSLFFLILTGLSLSLLALFLARAAKERRETKKRQ